MKVGQAVEILNKHKHDGRQWYVDKYGFACGPGGVLDNFFTPFEAVAIAEKLERRARRASGAGPREKSPPAPSRWTAEPPRKPGFFWVRVRGGAPRLCEFRWGEDLGREPNPAISYAGPIPEPLDADEPDAPTLRDVAVAVLADMDKAASEMVDQGMFQPWRERLRAALAEGGGA